MNTRRTTPVGDLGRTVAASIRARRLHLGLTTVRLAADVNELGCPIGAVGITKVEGGNRRLTVDELGVFATALGIEATALLACVRCHGAPAPWTACLACGAEAQP